MSSYVRHCAPDVTRMASGALHPIPQVVPEAAVNGQRGDAKQYDHLIVFPAWKHDGLIEEQWQCRAWSHLNMVVWD